MSARALVLKERDVMAQATLTMHVHFKRDWRVRVGLWLIALGARFAGMGVGMEETSE
jgi:hypothetical protein